MEQPIIRITVTNNLERCLFLWRILVISKTAQGMVEVDGAVRNNNTFDMHDIEITGEFFDENGNSLGKFDEYVTEPSSSLKPNEKYTFNLFEVVSHIRLATTNITAFGAPAN